MGSGRTLDSINVLSLLTVSWRGSSAKCQDRTSRSTFSAGISLEPVNQSKQFPYLTSSLTFAWCWPSASCQRTFF